MSANETLGKHRTEAEVREALYELQRYFSDELAPMMVADSVETLLQYSPELGAEAIESWVGSQNRGAFTDAAVSDFLFHGFKKLYQLSEYGLLERKLLFPWLKGLASKLLAICPETERPLLRDNLARLGKSEGAAVAQAAYLHRQVGAAAPRGPGPAADATAVASEEGISLGMRRLSLLIERLGSTVGNSATGSPADVDLKSLLLATAAVQARDGSELESYLAQLREAGMNVPMDEIFRSLGRSLPAWRVATSKDDPSGEDMPQSRSAQAMRRLLEMTDDPLETIHRVNSMIQAAVEQFNDGSVVRASQVIDLAATAVRDKKPDPEMLKEMRRRAQEALSPERLREYVDRPEQHDPLRRVLAFFPDLTAEGLIDGMMRSERREQRRLALALLEAHGAVARDKALERLERFADDDSGDTQGFVRRNLIYLLRHIPPAEGTHNDRDVEALARAARASAPVLLLREAVGALGQFPHARAEQVLIALLAEFEVRAAEAIDEAAREETIGLLDRIVASLVRQASPAAFRTVVNHAFKREPALGDTLARLTDLGAHDLSSDPELVEHLLTILRRVQPAKVLGLRVARDRTLALQLVRALSRTRDPRVAALFEEIATRPKDREIAAAATEALAAQRAQAPDSPAGRRAARAADSAASLTGDVELFGLANLLQSLAESGVSGVLELTDHGPTPYATIELAGGTLVGCRHAGLDGDDAFYQLFEVPIAGSFAFCKAGEGLEASGTPIQSALLEALRRYDEFQQASALVPAEAALRSTGTKPLPIEDEADVALMREVWQRASRGVTPEACRAELKVDDYRVRRLYAHWFEGGALVAVGVD